VRTLAWESVLINVVFMQEVQTKLSILQDTDCHVASRLAMTPKLLHFFDTLKRVYALCIYPFVFDLLFSCGLYIDIRLDVSLNGSICFLESLDILPNQHKNVAVNTAPLIICHIIDLPQHFLFNSDGNTFNSHNKHPKLNILCVYFMSFIC